MITKVVMLKFDDSGKPLLNTMEEVVPVIVYGKSDIEYMLGRQITEQEFQYILQKMLDKSPSPEDAEAVF
jgi:CRISPR/Cas system CSM-associated protein Csm2 small subunit